MGKIILKKKSHQKLGLWQWCNGIAPFVQCLKLNHYSISLNLRIFHPLGSFYHTPLQFAITTPLLKLVNIMSIPLGLFVVVSLYECVHCRSLISLMYILKSIIFMFGGCILSKTGVRGVHSLWVMLQARIYICALQVFISKYSF